MLVSGSRASARFVGSLFSHTPPVLRNQRLRPVPPGRRESFSCRLVEFEAKKIHAAASVIVGSNEAAFAPCDIVRVWPDADTVCTTCWRLPPCEMLPAVVS